MKSWIPSNKCGKTEKTTHMYSDYGNSSALEALKVGHELISLSNLSVQLFGLIWYGFIPSAKF